jgi:hypothetical protein
LPVREGGRKEGEGGRKGGREEGGERKGEREAGRDLMLPSNLQCAPRNQRKRVGFDNHGQSNVKTLINNIHSYFLIRVRHVKR